MASLMGKWGKWSLIYLFYMFIFKGEHMNMLCIVKLNVFIRSMITNEYKIQYLPRALCQCTMIIVFFIDDRLLLLWISFQLCIIVIIVVYVVLLLLNTFHFERRRLRCQWLSTSFGWHLYSVTILWFHWLVLCCYLSIDIDRNITFHISPPKKRQNNFQILGLRSKIVLEQPCQWEGKTYFSNIACSSEDDACTRTDIAGVVSSVWRTFVKEIDFVKKLIIDNMLIVTYNDDTTINQ